MKIPWKTVLPNLQKDGFLSRTLYRNKLSTALFINSKSNVITRSHEDLILKMFLTDVYQSYLLKWFIQIFGIFPQNLIYRSLYGSILLKITQKDNKKAKSLVQVIFHSNGLTSRKVDYENLRGKHYFFQIIHRLLMTQNSPNETRRNFRFFSPTAITIGTNITSMCLDQAMLQSSSYTARVSPSRKFSK